MFIGRALIAMGVTVITARVVGPAGRGQIVLVTTVAGLVSLAASTGATVGINEMRGVDRMDSPRLHTAGALVSLLFSVPASVVVAIVFRSNGGGGLSLAAVAALGVATVALTVTAVAGQIAAHDDRLGAITWTALAGAIAYALVSAVTAVTDTMTVENNVAAWSVASLIPLALLFRPARVIVFARDTNLATAKRLAAHSLKANIAGLAVLAIWRIDVVIVSARRGFVELGQYSIAVAVAEVVVVGAMGIRYAVMPHHTEDPTVLADVLTKVTRIGLVATTALAVAVGVSAPLFIPAVFGSRFDGVAPALLLLLPGTVFLVLHYPLFDFLAARGHLGKLTALASTALAFNVAANWFVLGRTDFTAAAAISSVSYFAVFAATLVIVAAETGRPISEFVRPRRDDVIVGRWGSDDKRPPSTVSE